MSEANQFSFEVAVVGLAGRFPGVRNVDEFWDRLCDGAELISFFADDDPNYVGAEGVLDDVELFDASFFGFTPREAATLDPQHRIFLEESWAALETAGYSSETYHGRVGVFAGESLNTYFLNNLYPNRKLLESLGASQVVIANDRDYLATQVSFRLNLKGPSFTIQTACSTSLVAVHLACQSLLNRECDIALAGGVSVSVPQGIGGHYQEGGIISPDGHCRAFDAKARGTVKGNGAGVVVLKRLADAIHDRDTIHAIIKGSAINNDGATKVGFTAPAVEGQANVIEEALALASIEPETIGYVETHGTGTVLGDPVEIAALTQAFRTSTDATGFCPIGSVKTNIGHLDAAAGVASLIKTILALEHRQIPPSLNFEQPNPNIDFANSPFFVNTELRRWETNGGPRRAGVSSFGIGGTNAHVVLEEAPTSESFSASSGPYALVLSARTPTALAQASKNLAQHLDQHSQLDLADVAYTLGAGRKQFEHRQVVVCHDAADAVTALSQRDRSRVFTGASRYEKRPVAFMFPGQGAQYAGMGRALYEREPVFRNELDHCAELLRDSLGTDLREVIFESETLSDTRFAQPALFAVEYALAKLWAEWGVAPQAMIGHSIGEYVAACLAGVFSLEDALRLVAARGEIVQRLPRGAMLSVSLAPQEVERFLSDAISIAAVNSPSLCVLSGTNEGIEELQSRLAGDGVICRRLHTSHAFHSRMMEPALEEFTALVQNVERRAPRIPYLSNVTGTWITEAEVMDASYWARHLREPVQFSGGVAELLADPAMVLLEVGPGQSLGTLAAQQPAPDRVALASLRPPKGEQSEIEFLLKTVGRLWLAGVEIDWSRFYAGQPRRRVQLPSYPFERQRYWIDPPSTEATSSLATASEDLTNEIESATLFENAETFSTVAEVETAVIDIWRELFGIANIRPADNFFDHGGNSLIALQLVAQLRATFKIDLPLRIVFESQTVTALSGRIFEMIAQEQEMAELDSLLREIESLSPEGLQPQPSALAKSIIEFNVEQEPATRSINFGLYFFSGDGSNTSDHKYRLVLESAKFADRHGFAAIWTPERHFQDFGGLYPNPSVLSAALAVLTERIQIRAGSVALPLHHPVRVAEEWSLVDNLSHGRVAVSFASGWHTNDFIFAPDTYDDRKEVMFRHIELIQKLWAGEKIKLPGAGGSEVEFRILPRPVQPKLPVWITSSGSAETWRRAGEIGANVLAAYIGYSQEELAQRIELYREARARHGHDPQTGVVTIMLHTFVGDDDVAVKEKVRAPFSNYLRTYFRQYETTAAGVADVSEADKDALMSAAFEKYFETSTLMGSPEKCARLVEALVDLGVDEVACLIDFGVEADSVLASLERLSELKKISHAKAQRRKALPRF
jgi:natural product biosynthesis luciferase-like monooxygenase protein